MIQKTIVSFFDNLYEKARNPFLGTLAIVWIIRNYEGLYILLFSGRSTRYIDKIDTLKGLFVHEKLFGFILSTIGIAFIVLISTYLLKYLTRLIHNIFKDLIKPWMEKLTDKSAIVLKVDYEKVIATNKSLRDSVDEERKAKIESQAEVDRLAKKVVDLEANSIEPLLEDSKKRLNKAIEERESIAQKTQEEKIVEAMKSRKFETEFEELIYAVETDDFLVINNGIKFFFSIHLIKEIEVQRTERRYEFTALGRSVADFYRNTYL